MVFSTTEEFLRCFGISDLTELPDYDIIRENGQDKLYSQQVMEGLDNL
jgi:chromosome segregation and condensation protein ScpB